MNTCTLLAAIMLLTVLSVMADAGPDVEQKPTVSAPIPLWEAAAPGEKGDIPPEHDTTKQNKEGKPEDGIIRLGDVSRPTITVFSPPAARNNGAAVIVCPGGGYSILAYDLEGSEVCEWLNTIGVTGVLLKYRVPARTGQPRYTAPLQDAQRAISLVRNRAAEWKIDTKRVGILGFSAGGHLSAAASTNYETRTYPNGDAADSMSCRPDFTVLIYPAYLTTEADLTKLAPEIRVSEHTPPAFLAQTEDDPVHVENVLTYSLALKNVKVPFEVHVYPVGGHGYGLRPSPNQISHWPHLVELWMKSQGLLKAK